MNEESTPEPPGATAPSPRRLAPAPRLVLSVVREGGAPASREVSLDGARFSIGSHAKNDVVLADAGVSRFHCVVERGSQAWLVRDKGSLNGTFLAGVSVRDADLCDGCRLVLGDSELLVRTAPSVESVELLDQVSFGELYGKSRVMQQLFAVLEKVSSSDANVLIEGESGTGKEVVAAEVVRRGPRARKPFVIVDCSAISPNLIESELFGYARGAFTGADRERAGAFEAAHGGTVFLDEVGELPLEMQPKLLRVLESREVRRVGETSTRRVDVRVVAATNRELEREVNRGRFREDLYYRLSVVTVRVPPLRERLEDVELLVRVFLKALNATREERLFTPDVIASMHAYDWPGNVRELRNYVERSVVLESTSPAGTGRTRASAPPESTALAPGVTSAPSIQIDLQLSFRDGKERLVAAYERLYVAELMRWADGNVSRAARRANMDRMNLYRVLQRHGLRGANDDVK